MEYNESGLPISILSEAEVETAERWVGKNIEDPNLREIFGKLILHGRKHLYHSQIPMEQADCGLIFRHWGNEIYLTEVEGGAADETRLRLAVAVRAIASEQEDPSLWSYLRDFTDILEESQTDLKVICGGKR